MQTDNKIKTRNKYLKIRRRLNTNYIQTASLNIYHNLLKLPQMLAAQNFFIYLDFDNEVRTKLIFEWLKSQNKNIYFPRLENNVMNAVSEGLKFETHKFGFSQPDSTAIKISPEIIEIAIMPGLAFDRNKNRIGYGKGYYDKFIKLTSALKIGLAFSCQISKKILPFSKRDIPLDIIVTDKEIII